MKVISGIYKGRYIEGFNLDGTRPTMERVKESLFATIQDYLEESNILDLFSGSGNLGIEALSEGANYAYLVDSNPKAIKTIKKNIDNFGIENAKELLMDYKKALKFFLDNNIKFDIIFLDPPYQTNYIEESLQLISKYNLLNNNGIVICESDNINRIIYDEKYTCLKEKKYGDKLVVILKN